MSRAATTIKAISKRASPSSSADAPEERLGSSRSGTSRLRDFHFIKFRPADIPVWLVSKLPLLSLAASVLRQWCAEVGASPPLSSTHYGPGRLCSARCDNAVSSRASPSAGCGPLSWSITASHAMTVSAYMRVRSPLDDGGLYALFMRLNYWVVYCCGSVMSNPPALTGVDAPADATITLSATAFTFKLNSVPSSTTNLKLIICASAPQSNGISRAYSKAAEVGGPETPSTTAVDIKDDYEAKYGAVGAGNPKVFFKYFSVNTATGEKSGDMLAVAKFAATDEQPAPENQGGGEGEDENPEQGLGF